MDRRIHVPYFVTLAFGLLAAILRLWCQSAAVDSGGLPVMHLSVWVYFGAGGLLVLLALFFALRRTTRRSEYGVLEYGTLGFGCAIAAAVLIGLGAAAEFAEALREGPGITAPLLLLAGLVGCICLAASAWLRRQKGKRQPAAEILPVVYLLLKLLLNFRGWSTDPIILDYSAELVALILALLAVFYGAGFVLDKGRPRRTLFFAMAAVYFCAGAMMDGVAALSPAKICTYGGCLLWQLPVIWDLFDEG